MSHSDVNIQREMTHAKLTYMGVMNNTGRLAVNI